MQYITEPTNKQLAQAKKWLEAENAAHGHSFICNFNIIRDALTDGKIHFITDDKGDAVGLCVYRLYGESACEIVITDIHYQKRRQGLGKFLVENFIGFAKNNEIKVLSLECAPKASEKFWSAVDFSLVPHGVDPNHYNDPPVRMWRAVNPILEESATDGIDGCIELWACPQWKADGVPPAWQWSLDFSALESVPIIAPVNQDWFIRSIAEGKIKHVDQNFLAHAPFLILESRDQLQE